MITAYNHSTDITRIEQFLIVKTTVMVKNDCIFIHHECLQNKRHKLLILSNSIAGKYNEHNLHVLTFKLLNYTVFSLHFIVLTSIHLFIKNTDYGLL